MLDCLQIAEMLPSILTHLGPDGVNHLKKMAMANSMAPNSRILSTLGEDDEIPDLVQNFESQLNAGAAGESSEIKPPAEVVD